MFGAISDAPYQLKLGAKVRHRVRKCLCVVDGLRVPIPVSIDELLVDVRRISAIEPIVQMEEGDGAMESTSKVVILTQEVLIIRRDNLTPIAFVVIYS
jgi:hypothetical protein